jgi:hypothetical protein
MLAWRTETGDELNRTAPRLKRGVLNDSEKQHLLPALHAVSPYRRHLRRGRKEWETWRERTPGNNGPNGFDFAPGDDGPGGNGNWKKQQDPDNSGNGGDDDHQGSAYTASRKRLGIKDKPALHPAPPQPRRPASQLGRARRAR